MEQTPRATGPTKARSTWERRGTTEIPCLGRARTSSEIPPPPRKGAEEETQSLRWQSLTDVATPGRRSSGYDARLSFSLISSPTANHLSARVHELTKCTEYRARIQGLRPGRIMSFRRFGGIAEGVVRVAAVARSDPVEIDADHDLQPLRRTSLRTEFIPNLHSNRSMWLLERRNEFHSTTNGL
jgi:hypothetical protein